MVQYGLYNLIRFICKFYKKYGQYTTQYTKYTTVSIGTTMAMTILKPQWFKLSDY